MFQHRFLRQTPVRSGECPRQLHAAFGGRLHRRARHRLPRGAVADATSFSSGSAARDRKVLSRTFLDTDSHPDITFTSTGAHRDADGTWRLDGLLTARGVRAPVVFTVTRAQMLDEELELTATATVDRYAHDITAMKGMAGRFLWLSATIRARRAPAARPRTGPPIKEKTA
ncbi:YceI family protein [Streptomyces kaempferi]